MAALATMRGQGGRFASRCHAACRAAPRITPRVAHLSSEQRLVTASEVAAGGRRLIQRRQRMGRGEISDGRDGIEWNKRRAKWGETGQDKQ